MVECDGGSNHEWRVPIRLFARSVWDMTSRSIHHQVTFRLPFKLPGWDQTWPPGTYTVTTEEESLDTSFPAYHRVSTTIQLRRGAETRYVEILPLDLAYALDRDRMAGD